jgi:mono/diheme cytochrome c family protein
MKPLIFPRVALIGGLLLVSVGAVSAQYRGWDVTRANRDERSPLASVPGTAARGQKVFAANCARCHGPEGKGNGPESDHAADLTDEFRIELNTEGALFYKMWGGHSIQLRTEVFDMPAFKDKLSRDDVWAVVEYVKVLRTPQR